MTYYPRSGQMPPLQLPIRLFGRTVRPVALGFAFLMLAMFIQNVFGVGPMGESPWAHFAGGAALVGFCLLSYGWWSNQQSGIEYGLWVSSGVLFARAAVTLMLDGPKEFTAYMAFGVGVIAAGSYILERLDAHTLVTGRRTHGST